MSASSAAALERYHGALALTHSYFGDPLAAAAGALALDPGLVMAHCLRAGVLAMATDRRLEPALRESVEAAERLCPGAHERERRHVAACRAWLEGDFARAVRLWGDVAVDYPRDTLALQLAHLGDFYLGQTPLLRDRLARALPHFDETVPGFGYVLGMHAFGLEENGDYARAEEVGRRALELQPRDPWSVHAVAHVMEMQGRHADGIAWLTSRQQDWAPDNGFAFHNWWHLALFHLDVGDTRRVLQLFDTVLWPRASSVVLEGIDAAALLWRLHLLGVDVAGRWEGVAGAWAATLGDTYYAFNDMHLMMALAATGREQDARALLAALEARAQGGGTNATLTREVGLPVCRALHAFGTGAYREAAELLVPVLPHAHRFGGSNAQRDVLHLTALEAALRARQPRLARALAAERCDRKPTSPLGWAFTARALEQLGFREAADHSRRRAEALRARAGSASHPRVPAPAAGSSTTAI